MGWLGRSSLRRAFWGSRELLRGGSQVEVAGKVHVAGEGFGLLPVNENFQAAQCRHVVLECLNDGIYHHLFAQDSRRYLGNERVGEIRDARAIRKNVEAEKLGVRGKSALLGGRRRPNQRVKNLFRPLRRVGRERQLDGDRRKLIRRPQPRKFSLRRLRPWEW